MGEKDSGEKLLEDYADVFADIMNVLAFHGERLLEEENITPGPTASIYKDEYHKLREHIRDVTKIDQKKGTVFSVIGVENQTGIDPDMVFRVMGYDYTSYRTQIGSGEKNRYPIFTVVLYFGLKPWLAPKNLFEALNFREDMPYRKYLPELISNIRLNLVEVAYLPKEVREQFTSDFRIIADYFCGVREGREAEFFNDTRVFKHVEEMLDFFRIFSGDERYREIKKPVLEKAERGEPIRMCTLLDAAINKGMMEGELKGKLEGKLEGRLEGKLEGRLEGKLEGRLEGKSEGKLEGTLKTYYSLIVDGLLTAEQAAGRMGLSPSEFTNKIEELDLRIVDDNTFSNDIVRSR